MEIVSRWAKIVKIQIDVEGSLELPQVGCNISVFEVGCSRLHRFGLFFLRVLRTVHFTPQLFAPYVKSESSVIDLLIRI
jgi:hypothetical protein